MQASDRLLLSVSDVSDDGAWTVSTEENGDSASMSTKVVRSLNEKATSKLAELIRRTSDKTYRADEIAAAKNLLNKVTQTRQR